MLVIHKYYVFVLLNKGCSYLLFCDKIKKMNELFKNIGLGLFVNGSFALLNGVFTLQSWLITLFSICIMAFCIFIERK